MSPSLSPMSQAPLHDQHRHAGQINSELRYKRRGLEGQKGKGVQLDDANPFQQTFTEAQKFTSGIEKNIKRK